MTMSAPLQSFAVTCLLVSALAQVLLVLESSNI
jgi:hypothetical protein